MRKQFAAAVIGLGVSLGVTGCGDFLTGPKLSDNPNRPIAATNANLLVASQTNLAGIIEGHLGRTICVWMQQCAGTRLQYNSLGQYIVGDDDYFIPWSQLYGAGGLFDLRVAAAASPCNRRFGLRRRSQGARGVVRGACSGRVGRCSLFAGG